MEYIAKLPRVQATLMTVSDGPRLGEQFYAMILPDHSMVVVEYASFRVMYGCSTSEIAPAAVPSISSPIPPAPPINPPKPKKKRVNKSGLPTIPEAICQVLELAMKPLTTAQLTDGIADKFPEMKKSSVYPQLTIGVSKGLFAKDLNGKWSYVP